MLAVMSGVRLSDVAELSHFPEDDSATLAERGRALRRVVPRDSHASWAPAANRPDPLELIQWRIRNRLSELVPIRWGRMSASPFAYYRGSPYVMAYDLSSTPTTGVNVQICGDAHLLNFGLFATPERHLVFDVNDFDETLPGPWEWDVKRLAASVVIAARANGFSKASATTAAVAVGRSYRQTTAALAGQGMLSVWYSKLELDQANRVLRETLLASPRRSAIDRARQNDHHRSLKKLTQEVDGRLQIREDPPLIVRITDRAVLDHAAELFDEYMASIPEQRRVLLRSFRLIDAAQKVVGVGSVATRCSVALLLGLNNDPLFLQVKEAEQSILEPFVGSSAHANSGHRVVVGQHTMQVMSDLLLGWAQFHGRSYYVRQLHDMKGTVDTAAMSPRQLREYAQLCAATLARAHSRSGLAPLTAGYLGTGTKFDEALGAFATAYADQNQRDYERLQDAIRDGRIDARTGL
jgi:uncharacterized protein (DUF2252 family)